MKKYTFFFVFITIYNISFSNKNSNYIKIYIKPFKEFQFKALHLSTYNPFYGYQKLDIIPSKENEYYKFVIKPSKPFYYRIENELNNGIGLDIYAEPGDSIYADFFLANIVSVKIKSFFSGNNTICQNIYPSIVEINSLISATSFTNQNETLIKNYVDSLFQKIIFSKINFFTLNENITDQFNVNVLQPKLILYKEFFVNMIEKKTTCLSLLLQILYT